MGKRKNRPPAHDRAVYGMAVAAELTGVNPPMLRTYEARGLISPHRTDGGTRRYSADDITGVHRITELLDAGLNLAGIEAVLALERENEALKAEVEQLRDLLGGQDGQAEPRGTL
jgi:MerR family transcriptional regulator/heat shock protein HspR